MRREERGGDAERHELRLLNSLFGELTALWSSHLLVFANSLCALMAKNRKKDRAKRPHLPSEEAFPDPWVGEDKSQRWNFLSASFQVARFERCSGVATEVGHAAYI